MDAPRHYPQRVCLTVGWRDGMRRYLWRGGMRRYLRRGGMHRCLWKGGIRCCLWRGEMRRYLRRAGRMNGSQSWGYDWMNCGSR